MPRARFTRVVEAKVLPGYDVLHIKPGHRMFRTPVYRQNTAGKFYIVHFKFSCDCGWVGSSKDNAAANGHIAELGID